MIHRSEGSRSRKTKKSYTLSPEAVEFLETLKRKQHAESASAVLEQVIAAARKEQERAAVDRAVSDYYGALSDDEASENAAWGDFALREFSKSEHGE